MTCKVISTESCTSTIVCKILVWLLWSSKVIARLLQSWWGYCESGEVYAKKYFAHQFTKSLACHLSPLRAPFGYGMQFLRCQMEQPLQMSEAEHSLTKANRNWQQNTWGLTWNEECKPFCDLLKGLAGKLIRSRCQITGSAALHLQRQMLIQSGADPPLSLSHPQPMIKAPGAGPPPPALFAPALNRQLNKDYQGYSNLSTGSAVECPFDSVYRALASFCLAPAWESVSAWLASGAEMLHGFCSWSDHCSITGQIWKWFSRCSWLPAGFQPNVLLNGCGITLLGPPQIFLGFRRALSIRPWVDWSVATCRTQFPPSPNRMDSSGTTKRRGIEGICSSWFDSKKSYLILFSCPGYHRLLYILQIFSENRVIIPQNY